MKLIDKLRKMSKETTPLEDAKFFILAAFVIAIVGAAVLIANDPENFAALFMTFGLCGQFCITAYINLRKIKP
jgi:hypothetical protein